MENDDCCSFPLSQLVHAAMRTIEYGRRGRRRRGWQSWRWSGRRLSAVLHTILVGTAAASVCTIAANVRDVAAVTTLLLHTNPTGCRGMQQEMSTSWTTRQNSSQTAWSNGALWGVPYQSHSTTMRSTMDVGHSRTESHTIRHMTLVVFLPSIQHVMMCGGVSQSE